MELNFEGLQMQKRNISADNAQRLETKTGVICLVVMFFLGFMVIKMSKKTYFLCFLLMTAKISPSFSKILKSFKVSLLLRF